MGHPVGSLNPCPICGKTLLPAPQEQAGTATVSSPEHPVAPSAEVAPPIAGCSSCGCDLQPGQRFCGSCGTPKSQAVASAASVPTTENSPNALRSKSVSVPPAAPLSTQRGGAGSNRPWDRSRVQLIVGLLAIITALTVGTVVVVPLVGQYNKSATTDAPTQDPLTVDPRDVNPCTLLKAGFDDYLGEVEPPSHYEEAANAGNTIRFCSAQAMGAKFEVGIYNQAFPSQNDYVSGLGTFVYSGSGRHIVYGNWTLGTVADYNTGPALNAYVGHVGLSFRMYGEANANDVVTFANGAVKGTFSGT